MQTKKYRIAPILEHDHFSVSIESDEKDDFICINGKGKFDVSLYSDDKSSVLATSGEDSIKINIKHTKQKSFIIHITQDRIITSYNFSTL